ncbi:MAG: hypothetical protein J0653_05700, partial [Deltaproteobacteria bacterium]|nr:hypothetical protein [Deltaproteobacteria bacterium]
MGATILWDADSKIALGNPLKGGDSEALAFSPDGKWLAVGGTDGKIFLWDVETRELVVVPLVDVYWNNQISSLAFSPDG